VREVPGEGPCPAKVMIVGEAPGAEEDLIGRPFVGAAGAELNRMLTEAGLDRNQCFVSNVVRLRPPANDISAHVSRLKKCPASDMLAFRDGWATSRVHEGYTKLLKEIDLVKPNIIIAFGNVALWALSGKWGVGDWRGSELTADIPGTLKPKLLPTFHPAAVLRQWSWRSATVADLRRAALNANSRDYPPAQWQFRVRPSFTEATRWLHDLGARLNGPGRTRISFDLETRHSHIACAGFATSETEGFCIPFMAVGSPDGYWGGDEECELIRLIRGVLTHPNADIVGQNLLYDYQYTYRWWHFVGGTSRRAFPRALGNSNSATSFDTMVAWHTAFVEQPKALDYQASLLCDRYVFWKNDSKVWDPKVGEAQLWTYNCEDACRTFEISVKHEKTLAKLGLEAQNAAQQAMFWPVLQAMQRGVRIDTSARSDIAMELIEEIAKRELWIEKILGHPLNPRSQKQMLELFYGDFNLRPTINRTTGRPTLNDDALNKISASEPILRPLVNAIADIRTLGIFLSTFVKAPLDSDGRMRCSFNICGTHTFRLSSSENAFGSGTNLQNIPAEKSKSVGKAMARGSLGRSGFSIPNIRRLFIPDQGFTFFDLDLARADLYIVVWESGDVELKSILKSGADIHRENAKVLFGENATDYQREFAKVFCHAANYGATARTLATHVGVSVHQADQMLKIWFGAHPAIKRWQEAVKKELDAKPAIIKNIFGYKWFVFDRTDGLLGEALAWKPQSTVALLINKIWQAIYNQAPEIQVLLQVHDNLSGQFPTYLKQQCIDKLNALSQITIPYDDPLIIPINIKTSEKSWGECVKEPT